MKTNKQKERGGFSPALLFCANNKDEGYDPDDRGAAAAAAGAAVPHRHGAVFPAHRRHGRPAGV